MRIGIDARLWNETGVGRYIRNLVWQLQVIDAKNEYVLFVTKGVRGQAFGSEAQARRGLGVRDDRFKIVETSIRWHTVEEQFKFPKILKNEKLDLVHFPYFAIPVFYNKPFVVTIHDLIIHHFPTGVASTLHPLVYRGKRLGYEYIMKKAASKSKKILTVSNATKQEIIDHLDVLPEKIVVTYEGVDPSLRTDVKQSRSVTDSSSGLLLRQLTDRNDGYFLYVGNAYPHKNLERLLLAIKEIVSQNKNTELVLVGKRDYFYNKIQKRINELGISAHVRILQDVSDEVLQELYRNAQAVVLPSQMEGFGLPAVEAMANLQKIIVSDIPAFREICGSAGIYFNPDSTEELVSKLSEVLEKSGDPKYLEKIKAGRTRLEMFSWEKLAKETLAVYELFGV